MFEKLRLLKNHGYNPDLIIDIGAYKGSWSLQTFPIFQEAHYILIEANIHP